MACPQWRVDPPIHSGPLLCVTSAVSPFLLASRAMPMATKRNVTDAHKHVRSGGDRGYGARAERTDLQGVRLGEADVRPRLDAHPQVVDLRGDVAEGQVADHHLLLDFRPPDVTGLAAVTRRPRDLEDGQTAPAGRLTPGLRLLWGHLCGELPGQASPAPLLAFAGLGAGGPQTHGLSYVSRAPELRGQSNVPRQPRPPIWAPRPTLS